VMKSETRTVGLPVASCRLVMPIQSFHISDPGFSAPPTRLLPYCLFRYCFSASVSYLRLSACIRG
jgi:hypothetical protein